MMLVHSSPLLLSLRPLLLLLKPAERAVVLALRPKSQSGSPGAQQVQAEAAAVTEALAMTPAIS